MTAKYRKLDLQEVTRTGDQRRDPDGGQWEDVVLVGERCDWLNPFLEYRRPIDEVTP